MVSVHGGPGDCEDDEEPEIVVSGTQFGRTIMMEKGSVHAWLSTTVVVKLENCR